MKVYKDHPESWVRFKPNNNFCDDCIGTCCSMPLEVTKEDLLRLELTFESELNDLRKLAKRLIREGFVKQYRHATEIFTIQTTVGDDCCFLDQKTRKCTVYDKRPSVCRDFPRKRSSRLGYCPKIIK